MLTADQLPDIRKLFYMREALRHGSLRRAAHMLGMTQPALSRHIQDLEALFGITLMQRSSTGSRCTEAGAVLLDKIDDLMGVVADMSGALADMKSHPAGIVTVAMPSSCTSVFLPELVEIFAGKYPNVNIRVMEGSARHIQEWVIAQQADIGVVVAPTGSNALLEEIVLREELLLFGPSNKERRAMWQLSDVAALPMVVPLPPYGTRKIIDALFGSAKVPIRPLLEIDNPLTIRDLVVNSGYYTIASPLIFLDEMAQATVHGGCVEGKPIRNLAIASMRDAALNRATRALAAELRRLMRRYAKDAASGVQAPSPKPARREPSLSDQA